MSGAIYTLASGAVAQKLRLEALSNNIANAGTVGFKMDKVAFRMPDGGEIDRLASPDAETGSAILSPLIPVVQKIDFTPGPQKATGNPLDLALEGEGFFCVATDSGVRYTRNGSFALSPEGVLTTHEGYPVLGSGGEIVIDGSDVHIDQTGNVFVDGEAAGTLRIVRFGDPDRLRKAGEGLFTVGDDLTTEEAVDTPAVHQGYLEASNVNTVKMMTDMIEVLRGYETYQKVIRTIDESTARAIASVGSPE